MHFVLLTWNPGAENDHAWGPDSWNDDMVGPTLAGNTVTTSWSVSRHVNNIEPGDVAFMYRQGEFGRGIVARGTIRSHPVEDLHWEDVTKFCNYVDVEWEECVPADTAADVEQLEALAPEFEWRKVYASGRQLPGPVGRKLSRTWEQYVRSDGVRSTSALYTSDVWRDFMSANEVVFV